MDTEADVDETDKEVHTRGKVLTILDIQTVYQDFQAPSHGDQMLSLPEFSGESSGDVSKDWLIHVELV